MTCDHDWKKTVDKSGFWFIWMCHKCYAESPYHNGRIPVEDEIYWRLKKKMENEE